MKRKFTFVASLALLAGLAIPAALFAGGSKEAATQPVKLSITDVAGNLQLSQTAIESFKAANPNLVSDIEYVKLTAPELVAKIKAQEMANNLVTTLVLTGYQGMSPGIVNNVYEQLMPKYQDVFQKDIDNYVPGAKGAYDLFNGYGIALVYCPAGPIFEYNPEKVPNPPKTAGDLLAWAKANPGKFLYANPANSGPGTEFLFGLPYILGDSNPKDPATWDKTWAYLKELGQYVDYYPSGTSITFKEMAEGVRWIIASHVGWDVNQRVLGVIPANYQTFSLDNTTLVTDSQFMAIPKGLDPAREKATIALMHWLLQPKQQSTMFDDGYFWPGPAIKGVTLDMAPQAEQNKLGPVVRLDFENQLNTLQTTTTLDAKGTVAAYDTWNKLIGSQAHNK
jgi:putative spermidine/putrescine transport system substrate-binding protein